ncbi:MAG: phosphatidate cytidylyltransferase [Spirochaetaceae bacterium]|nr:MAG: phosphatidate cytidylyltransferase [Spirochaetaceae bacterium]
MTEKQKNIRNRLLVFFIGIPATLALLIFLPHANHLATAFVVLAVSCIATRELSQLFEKEYTQYPGTRFFTPLLGGVFPVFWYLEHSSLMPEGTAFTAGLAVFALIIGFQGFRRNEALFPHIRSFVPTNIFLTVYPGLFIAHIIRIAFLPHATILLIVYVTAVYLNDSTAYASGMLFGRKNGGVLPISPNKSIAGFGGGFFASVVVTTTAWLFAPEVFPGSIFTAIGFGLYLGAATIAGDLAESAIKRSAAMKDSGNIIPGRGGLLDSIDSLSFAAPFFYFGYQLFFLQGA